MTHVLLRTADVKICSSAILVLAFNLIGIQSVGVAWWTGPRAAHADRCATMVVILRLASPIGAKKVEGIIPLNRMHRADLFVTMCPKIAARLSVAFPAKPIFAEGDGRVNLVYVLRGAMIRVAMALFNTAYVIVGLLTTCVFAKNVVSIMPMLEARRAFQAIASALGSAACKPLVVGTMATFANNIVREGLQSETSWASVVSAGCISITASVPVGIRAIEASAINTFRTILVDKAVWTLISVALLLGSAANRILGITAVCIAAQ